MVKTVIIGPSKGVRLAEGPQPSVPPPTDHTCTRSVPHFMVGAMPEALQKFRWKMQSERPQASSERREAVPEDPQDAKRAVEVCRTAVDFLMRRYRKLGIVATPKDTVVANIGFKVPDLPGALAGRASPYVRYFEASSSAPLLDSYSDAMQENFLTAVTVHELSHALGSVRFQSNPSNTVTEITRHGAGLSPLGLRPSPSKASLFRLFEEGAACAHEQAFLRSKKIHSLECWGGRLQHDLPYLDDLTVRAALLTHKPGTYRELKDRAVSHSWSDVIRECVREPLQQADPPKNLTIMWSMIKYEASADLYPPSDQKLLETTYGEMNYALFTLARELYPEFPKADAIEELQSELCKIQAGAPYAPLLRRITSVLGVEGVQFLANLDPCRSCRKDSVRLNLFAEAGKLDPERKREVRRLLLESHKIELERENSWHSTLDHIKDTYYRERKEGYRRHSSTINTLRQGTWRDRLLATKIQDHFNISSSILGERDRAKIMVWHHEGRKPGTLERMKKTVSNLAEQILYRVSAYLKSPPHDQKPLIDAARHLRADYLIATAIGAENVKSRPTRTAERARAIIERVRESSKPGTESR